MAPLIFLMDINWDIKSNIGYCITAIISDKTNNQSSFSDKCGAR